MLSGEELEFVDEIVTELIERAVKIIDDYADKVKSVKIYHEIFIQALEGILNVYDMPKPCTDFEDIIEAWKRDKPVQPLTPDNLITSKFFLKNESN